MNTIQYLDFLSDIEPNVNPLSMNTYDKAWEFYKRIGHTEVIPEALNDKETASITNYLQHFNRWWNGRPVEWNKWWNNINFIFHPYKDLWTAFSSSSSRVIRVEEPPIPPSPELEWKKEIRQTEWKKQIPQTKMKEQKEINLMNKMFTDYLKKTKIKLPTQPEIEIIEDIKDIEIPEYKSPFSGIPKLLTPSKRKTKMKTENILSPEYEIPKHKPGTKKRFIEQEILNQKNIFKKIRLESLLHDVNAYKWKTSDYYTPSGLNLLKMPSKDEWSKMTWVEDYAGSKIRK